MPEEATTCPCGSENNRGCECRHSKPTEGRLGRIPGREAQPTRADARVNGLQLVEMRGASAAVPSAAGQDRSPLPGAVNCWLQPGSRTRREHEQER